VGYQSSEMSLNRGQRGAAMKHSTASVCLSVPWSRSGQLIQFEWQVQPAEGWSLFNTNAPEPAKRESFCLRKARVVKQVEERRTKTTDTMS